ncbi:MAG: PilC/PilY family type IV pilus protein, partial [Thermodesulfobacteriota bacterium]
ISPKEDKEKGVKVGTVLDSTQTPVLDSNNLINDASKSHWSSQPDGNNIEKGGVGEVLLSRTNPRNIFTSLGSDPNLRAESNAFMISNKLITPELLGLAPGDKFGRERLIQYVHGYDSYKKRKDGETPKKRQWILGAIVNSRPLIIPYENNQSVIFVGANDGMFHAFDDATGEELWGFIPYEFLNRLKDMTRGVDPKWYVDGSPKAYVTKSQKIVIFGLRRGGSNYYALDVTDPDNPRFMWKIGLETTGFSEMGQTWSTPQIKKIKDGTGTKVVCFIGGGYDENQDRKSFRTEDKKGRAVYVVDLFTGEQVWRWDFRKDPDMNYSIPSDVSCVDTNGDGYVDRLYVGDMGGRLWRFDIKNPDPSAWSGRIVFNTNIGSKGSGRRKIFHQPDVTLENDFEKIFFGTGDREHPDDVTIVNCIYSIEDKNQDFTLSENDLRDVTKVFLHTRTIEDKNGWFISLDENAGEKVSGPPVVLYKVVYFPTFAPSSEGGIARIYALNYNNGDPILNLNPSNDSNGAKIDLSDRLKVIGKDIPSGTIISAIKGKLVGYIGIVGGVYQTPLRRDSVLVPIWWRVK